METAESIHKRKRSREFSVGLLAIAAIALMGVFGWLMGAWRPFSSEIRFHLMYGFAGGVEVGSPVRVSGVKVGRVETITFLAPGDRQGASIDVTIAVSNRAAASIRQDSKFFINMAGIIGERYVEISHGSAAAGPLEPGARVRGEDPPRIDQLLSQGYGVFGKVQEFLEENESVITEFLSQAKGLMTEANQLLKRKDRQKLFQLLDNMVVITDDVKGFTQTLKDEKSRKFFEQMVELMARAHGIDKNALKKFLQEEGIRARIF